MPMDLTNEDDIFTGNETDQEVNGLDGNDILDGAGGDDTLNGDNGNDTLIGGAGADILNGGADTDTADYSTSGAGVTITLDSSGNGTGTDGDAEGDVLTSIENVIGSDFDDVINSIDSFSVLDGGAGNDTISASNSNESTDTLIGGTGDDILNGRDGNDIALYTGDSTDYLISLNDVGEIQITDLRTGPENEGVDTLINIERFGFADGEFLLADVADTVLFGDDDANTLIADADDIHIAGLGGSDILVGNALDNQLFGGLRNDTLNGGAGADLLDGGGNVDTADYSTSDAGVNVAIATDGTGVGSGGHAEGDQYVSIENIIGSDFDDVLSSNGNKIKIDGGAGNDSITGSFNRDNLFGGTGDDSLFGGSGDDSAHYTGNSTDYLVSINEADQFQITDLRTGPENEGTDILVDIENLVFADGAFALLDVLDDTILVGTNGGNTLVADADDIQIFGFDGNDDITGNALDNEMFGGDGADDFFESVGDGSDFIDGGDNGDRVFYDADHDAFTFDVDANGNLLVTDATGDTDTLVNIEQMNFNDGNLNVANLIATIATNGADLLEGSGGADTIDALNGDDVVNGNGGDDILLGNRGSDDLFGGDGDDVLNGFTGDDLLDGGDGIDTADYSNLGSSINVSLNVAGPQNVSNAGGNDTLISIENLIGSRGGDTLLGNNAANVIDGFLGNDFLFGLGGDDLILGGDRNDVLRGNNGDDVLIGGTGRDLMGGGAGADTFVFETLADSPNGGFRDRIQDFEQGVDKIDLSAIDAITGGGDDAFTFIGEAGFGAGDAGALRFIQVAGTNKTIVLVDVDGDNVRDTQFELTGIFDLTADDFIL